LKAQGWQKDIKKQRLYTIILTAGSIFFLIPNIFFAIQGFSIRYWADDYCFSGFIREHGFTHGLIEFYSTTSNRFSAFIFTGFSELFGENAIRVIPTLVIIFLGFILYKIIDGLLSKNHIEQSKNISVLFSQILLFFILYLAPNIHQSVYWRSGISHYFLPVPVLLFLLLIIFFSGKTEKKNLNKVIFLFFISFFVAGLSESYAALQMGLFGIALLFMLFMDKSIHRKHRSYLIGSILMGTAVAMGVMIVSPGNTLRLDTLQQASDIFSIVSISSKSAINFIILSIRGLWLPFCIMFGLFVLITFYFIQPSGYEIQARALLIIFFFIPVVAFALIICICAPTAYGMMAYPEQRVLILAQVVLICGVSMEGVILGLLFQKFLYIFQPIRMASLFLILIFSMYPLSTLDVRQSDLRYYINRAALWDKRNVEINNQITIGKNNLSVSALDSFAEIAELKDDVSYWVNRCASRYYEVESITAVEK
jgi:hypothetical protein